MGLAALVLAAVVSRLPQLTSPALILDGDEAVLGLMSLHIAQGQAWPLFFYGQTYGLAIVEAVLGAATFTVFGAGAIPLKLAMLVLWCTGVVSHHRALSRVVGTGWATMAMALLVMMPAWAVWSMKARGGYLTAFAATGAILALLARSPVGDDGPAPGPGLPAWARWTMVGAACGVVFLAQRLWLPGLAPVVLAAAWLERRRVQAVAGAAVGLWVVLLGAALASGLTLASMVSMPRPANPHPFGAPAEFLSRVYTNLTGSYYLWMTVEPGSVTALLATVSLGVLAALFALQAWRLATRRWLRWSHVLAVSVSVTLVIAWTLVDGVDARYLLPLSAWMWMWMAVEAADLSPAAPTAPVPAAIVGSLLALGVLSSVEFRRYEYLWPPDLPSVNEAGALDALLQHLRAHGVRHAFTTNGLLQWQIAFYSREEIVARFRSARDRYPPYVAAVDEALASGRPVALVGYLHGLDNVQPVLGQAVPFTVAGRYFAYIGPDERQLRQLRFGFAADAPHR